MNARPITEEDLHAWMDGLLDPEREGEVQAHLDAHPDAAARFEGYRACDAALRACLADVADEPVPARLDVARMVAVRRRMRPTWWQAAAAAVLLCLGGAGGWALRGDMSPASSGLALLTQEAAYSYAAFAPDHTRPVEVRAAERADLLDWASRRLRRPLSVPDLSGSGFRFMGGRMIATPRGAAVMFMYDDDHGTRLVMVTCPMAIEKPTRMAEHHDGDLAGFAWADRGIGYSLVGPVPADVLHPIANQARRQIEKDV